MEYVQTIFTNDDLKIRVMLKRIVLREFTDEKSAKIYAEIVNDAIGALVENSRASK